MTDRIRLNEGNRRWWTLAAMCFALFMIMLDNTVVNVALPSIQDDLGARSPASSGPSTSTRSRSPSCWSRAGASATSSAAAGCSSSASSCSRCPARRSGCPQARAGSSPAAPFRASGAAFMMPATLSIITVTFPPEERGKAIGTWAGVSALALAIGPVVGGALAEYVSWRAIFFLNLPVAVGAVVVTLFATHESRDETTQHSIDWPGIAALSVGLSALVLALVEGNAWGWGSTGIVALLAAAVGRARRLRSDRAARARADGRLLAVSARGRSWARTSSPSSSRSRCSRCSSSPRSTCRTSSATPPSRRACASSLAR